MLKFLALASLVAITAGAAPLSITSDQLKRKGSATVELLAGQTPEISVRFDDPGWDSGVRVLPPPGQEFWDLSGGKILSVDVENLSPDKQLRLNMNVNSGNKERKTLAEANVGIGLNPGEKRTLNLLIPHRFIYAAPKGVPGPRVIDSDKINAIEFYMQWSFEAKRANFVDCKISNLRITGEPDIAAKVEPGKFFPFIDVYGQYAHGDWPEKIRSDADLRNARAAELRELDASKRPEEWNRYGGWANGPQLKATGHFRTEKYQGKWFLVDPEGRLFFSHGVDVLRPHTDGTTTKNHESWFSFPVNAPVASFTHWNLQKKYGKGDYEADFYATLSRRLEHWGMNTIGNWGHTDLMLLGKTPYTLQLTDYNPNLPRLAGGKLKFYDVFDPAYIDAMKNLVATAAAKDPAVAKSLTDPLCIGYFIDNEINYGNRGARQILGDIVLKSPAQQASKTEFVGDLKARHGTIAALNQAWETSYASWEALLAETNTVPDSKGYRTDSNVFFHKAVDQYFRLCRDAIKSVAPHRLYLGSRFISTDAVRKSLHGPSLKYCDVLTANVYAHSVANLGGGEFPDMPVMIGEFHFGVRDRGMFVPGVVSAGVTQEDRAMAYTRFVQGALMHPNIVGTHWFQFRDQPLTGRWDGEGYQIGFVDVADTPYAEIAQAARKIGETMYAYRLKTR